MSSREHVDHQQIDAGVVPSLVDAVRLFRTFQRAEMRLTLQIKAIERSLTRTLSGGQSDLEAHSRHAADSVADHVSNDTHEFIVGQSEGEESQASVDTQKLSALLAHFGALPLIDARDSIRKHRRKAEREVSALAKSLPCYAWIESVRGCGPLGLGLIVGEAGDLSVYANPGKLWKRMGLAVFDGKAQRRIAGRANIRTGKTKGQAVDDAIAQGYSPRRRSLMHVIGESLLKQNGKDGYYRSLYDERKAYEMAQHPEFTKLQWHRRALRYMEKRFLLHLWQAWKRQQTTPVLEPSPCLSAADHDNTQQAISHASPKALLPAELVEA